MILIILVILIANQWAFINSNTSDTNNTSNTSDTNNTSNTSDTNNTSNTTSKSMSFH